MLHVYSMATQEYSYYVNYLRSFLDTDDGWSFHQVSNSHNFFLGNGLASIPAGSVIIISSWDLEDRIIEETTVEYLQTRLLNSPRLWALLNNPKPLIIMNIDGGSCTLDWPNRTHHMLYRATWNQKWHEEWIQSQALENTDLHGARPKFRSIPFGTSFANGHTAELSEQRRPISNRSFLISFRGTAGSGKKERSKLANAFEKNNFYSLTRAIQHLPVHSSGLGRVVIDVISPGSHYRTADIISYLELLRSSIFTACPPGDLWETYRFWVR